MKIQIENVTKRACMTREKGAVLVALNVSSEQFDNLFAGDKSPRPYWNALRIAVYEAIPELNGCRLTWSRKAGCCCPCSPGFVVSKNGRKTYDRYLITVSIGEEAK